MVPAVLSREGITCYVFPSTGITIGGLEQPLTVGQSATINCTTNIAVSSIELRNEAKAVLVNAADQRVLLELNISPVSDDLQRQQYTCRVETVEGTVYTNTVDIQVVGKLQ